MRKILLLLLCIPLGLSAQVDKDYNNGLEKYKLKDYRGAIADYTRAIKIDPDNISSYYGRATAKRNLKNNSGAIADCNKIIEIDPNNAETFFLRAVLKGGLGDEKGACKDARKSQELGYDASKVINIACK